jgi:homocitrate synthase NifV
VLALRYSARWGKLGLLDENIDLTKSWRIARYVANAFGVQIPINQPGVGDNCFAHESGIHADGALKDRHNYELYDYEVLGRGEHQEVSTGRVITTGIHGGASGLEYVYAQMDLAFTDAEHAKQVLKLVQYANLSTQAPLTDEELWLIYHYPEQVRKLLTLQP